MKYQDTVLSIVAADQKAGEFGVAVASASLAVGKNIPFTGAFVGAMAVQGYVGPFFGIAGMKLLREGLPAERVAAMLTADDLLAESRQILIIDAAGKTAAANGASLPPFAGVHEGDRYIVGGCGLGGQETLSAVGGTFEAAEGDLAARLLAALEAFAEGHEGLPLESAALRISRNDPYPHIDLRVDAHRDPVARLGELLTAWRAQSAPAGTTQGSEQA